MLLLLERLGFSPKMHNHHRSRHISDAFSASLQTFRSEVSNCLLQLSENSNPGSEFLSLTWIRRCFGMLPAFNNAFAKLMVEIDYPMSEWEGDSVEEYLDYTINLLELLNSVGSSLSHLSQARLSFLMENSPAMLIIKPVKKNRPGNENLMLRATEGYEEKLRSGREWVFHEAICTMKCTGFWVCGVVLSGLNCDSTSYMEMKKSLHGLLKDSSLFALDSVIEKEITEKGGMVKEVKEVNEKAGSDGVEEVRRRLKEIENVLKGLKEEEDDLFSKVLAARNEVLELLRRKIFLI